MRQKAMRAGNISTSFAAALAIGLLGTAVADADDVRPSLVLQITVDGLRGDLLNRYGDRFGPGGFRTLLTQGAVFTNAHYQHANTETIVGHTTLATGAHPSEHGMVGNVWYDRDSGELAYNIEDPQHALLPTRETSAKGTQVDPAQKRSRTSGRSPVSILASTLGDELWLHYAGKPKIFGVSGKDRSAVAMAGHMGKAFWFSTDSGDFQTSSFYYDAYPRWVKSWNEKRQAEALTGGEWRLLAKKETYLLGANDDRPYETDLKGYGRVFPHPFGAADDPLFYTRVLVSPHGDRLTADFTKALIVAEEIGKDDVPDYLSVSFSSVDAVSHFFGPSSLENEDVVLQLDRTLADLLAFVDENVGLDRTLIVLSADHGMPEAPELMAEGGMAVRRIDPTSIVDIANRIGREKFDLEDFIRSFFRPYLYLDPTVIEAKGVDQRELELAIAEELERHDGIAVAVSLRALASLQDTPTLKRIRNNTHAIRSGDIYIVQEPYWFLQEKGAIAVMHGSPWRYDTFVPIIFAGSGVKPGRISRLVHPADIAPTLAERLRIKVPSSSVGRPLREVFD